MLKQELIHSHILVAIFCGWEARKPNKEFPNGYLHLKEEDEEEQFMVSNDTVMEELPYLKDWNYLIEALKKYDEVVEEVMDSDEDEADFVQIQQNIVQAFTEYNNELIFKELVRGVEKYNQFKAQEHGPPGEV